MPILYIKIIKMVICIKCRIEKEKTEFYKHNWTSDGILHKCKECVKEYTRNQDRTEYDKLREQTPKRKKWKKNAQIKYRLNNPKKYRARQIVSNHYRYRKDEKPKLCSNCNSSRLIELHHEDYDKPREIIPLCSLCHKAYHKWKIQIDLSKTMVIFKYDKQHNNK